MKTIKKLTILAAVALATACGDYEAGADHGTHCGYGKGSPCWENTRAFGFRLLDCASDTDCPGGAICGDQYVCENAMTCGYFWDLGDDIKSRDYDNDSCDEYEWKADDVTGEIVAVPVKG